MCNSIQRHPSHGLGNEADIFIAFLREEGKNVLHLKRLLSFFAFKRLDGMITILSCYYVQLRFRSFPSGYFIPIRTFLPDTIPEISPIEQYSRQMMRNEAEVLYCIVVEHLYSTSHCNTPTKVFESSE